MAEDKQAPGGEECGDECVIDTQELLRRRAEREAAPTEWSQTVLVLLTQGTYGHFDDGFSAIQVGTAALSMEENATMLLLDDGVYFGVRNQDPSNLGLPNNTRYIEDFLDLGGRILALRSSLERRGIVPDDLLEGIEVVAEPRVLKEIEAHHASVTF